MSLFQSGATPWHIPTVAHNVFDVTGAGDTVVGTLAVARVGWEPLRQAIHLGRTAQRVLSSARSAPLR